MEFLTKTFKIVFDEKIKVLADCSFELEILDSLLNRTLFTTEVVLTLGFIIRQILVRRIKSNGPWD